MNKYEIRDQFSKEIEEIINGTGIKLAKVRGIYNLYSKYNSLLTAMVRGNSMSKEERSEIINWIQKIQFASLHKLDRMK